MKIKIFLLVIAVVLPLAACDTTDSEDESVITEISSGSSEKLPAKPEELPTAYVERVIDGDTLELEDGRKVRLIGINTPERENYLYEEATTFTRQLLEGKEVGLQKDVETEDQYGRTLFYVWVGDQLANYEIVRAGYALRYRVPPNDLYDSYLVQAENASRNEQLGLWQQGQNTLKIDTLQADAPGPDEENLNGEYVRIYNITDKTLNLSGYTLSDTSSNMYTFGDISLDPHRYVDVFTGCGQDTRNAVYWCSNTPIWNNSGDTAYLKDTQGLHVDYRNTGQN